MHRDDKPNIASVISNLECNSNTKIDSIPTSCRDDSFPIMDDDFKWCCANIPKFLKNLKLYIIHLRKKRQHHHYRDLVDPDLLMDKVILLLNNRIEAQDWRASLNVARLLHIMHPHTFAIKQLYINVEAVAKQAGFIHLPLSDDQFLKHKNQPHEADDGLYKQYDKQTDTILKNIHDPDTREYFEKTYLMNASQRDNIMEMTDNIIDESSVKELHYKFAKESYLELKEQAQDQSGLFYKTLGLPSRLIYNNLVLAFGGVHKLLKFITYFDFTFLWAMSLILKMVKTIGCALFILYAGWQSLAWTNLTRQLKSMTFEHLVSLVINGVSTIFWKIFSIHQLLPMFGFAVLQFAGNWLWKRLPEKILRLITMGQFLVTSTTLIKDAANFKRGFAEAGLIGGINAVCTHEIVTLLKSKFIWLPVKVLIAILLTALCGITTYVLRTLHLGTELMENTCDFLGRTFSLKQYFYHTVYEMILVDAKRLILEAIGTYVMNALNPLQPNQDPIDRLKQGDDALKINIPNLTQENGALIYDRNGLIEFARDNLDANIKLNDDSPSNIALLNNAFKTKLTDLIQFYQDREQTFPFYGNIKDKLLHLNHVTNDLDWPSYIHGHSLAPIFAGDYQSIPSIRPHENPSDYVAKNLDKIQIPKLTGHQTFPEYYDQFGLVRFAKDTLDAKIQMNDLDSIPLLEKAYNRKLLLAFHPDKLPHNLSPELKAKSMDALLLQQFVNQPTFNWRQYIRGEV